MSKKHKLTFFCYKLHLDFWSPNNRNQAHLLLVISRWFFIPFVFLDAAWLFPSVSLSFLFLFPLLGFLKCVYQAKRFSSRGSPLYFPAEKIALKKSRHKDDTSTRKCPITTRWAVAQQLYFFFHQFQDFMSGWEKGGAYFYIFKSDLFLPSWHYEKTLKRNNNWNIIIYIIAYKIKLRGRTWTIIG